MSDGMNEILTQLKTIDSKLDRFSATVIRLEERETAAKEKRAELARKIGEVEGRINAIEASAAAEAERVGGRIEAAREKASDARAVAATATAAVEAQEKRVRAVEVVLAKHAVYAAVAGVAGAWAATWLIRVLS